jgi:hypothetical protein
VELVQKLKVLQNTKDWKAQIPADDNFGPKINHEILSIPTRCQKEKSFQEKQVGSEWTN